MLVDDDIATVTALPNLTDSSADLMDRTVRVPVAEIKRICRDDYLTVAQRLDFHRARAPNANEGKAWIDCLAHMSKAQKPLQRRQCVVNPNVGIRCVEISKRGEIGDACFAGPRLAEAIGASFPFRGGVVRLSHVEPGSYVRCDL